MSGPSPQKNTPAHLLQRLSSTPLTSALGAAALAVVLSAVVEVASVRWAFFGADPPLLFTAFVACVGSIPWYFYMTLMYPACFGLLAARFDGLRGDAAHGLCALAASAHTYGLFAQNPDIARHWVSFVCAGGLLVYLVVAAFVHRRPRLHLAWSLVVGLSGVIVAAVFMRTNVLSFRNIYPAVHNGLLQSSVLVAFAGAAVLLARVHRPRWRRASLGAFAVVVLGAALSRTPLLDSGRALVTSQTLLSHARALFEPFIEPRVPLAPPMEAVEAAAVFERFANLPPLPEGMALEDMNVLFILCEALRHDATSLHDPALRTTPNLARLVERGALWFPRAHAPSSGTLLSVSSLLTMAYPSTTDVALWRKSWHGTLLETNTTVPELFAMDRGRQTFWIGHDYKEVFDGAILGFDQGFHFVDRVPAGTPRTEGSVDHHIARRAALRVQQMTQSRQRFFGWVFFASPHAPYLRHDRASRTRDPHALYLQEVRAMDAQLGHLLDALERSGAMDRTIVIFSGDHGEEFDEHGGARHKATLYLESIQVPLVVWIPGVEGGPQPRPVSTLTVFPWLFQRGNEPQRAAASDALRNSISPMLAATGGAVISELIGHERMLVSLTYDGFKINHDLIADFTEVFDLEDDPGEQRPFISARFDGFVRAYLDARAARARYRIWPQRESPKRASDALAEP